MRHKLPDWLIGLALLWLAIGLPVMVFGPLYRGDFNPLPDPPPYFETPYEDHSFAANAIWLVIVAFVYVTPLVLLGFIIQVIRARPRNEPPDGKDVD